MRRFGWPLAAALVFALSSLAAAQQGGFAARPTAAVSAALNAKKFLGPRVRMLSQGTASFLHLADLWKKFQTTAPGGPGIVAVPPVSQRYLQATRFAGGVESETSTAWCGRNAVIAFNDDGSLLATSGGEGLLSYFGAASPTEGWTFTGYSNSTNADTSTATFTDEGYPPIPTADTMNMGDPVVVCGNSNDFYLSNLFGDFSVSGPSGCGWTEVSIVTSTDGGASFGDPRPVVREDACNALIDKDWMAINPNNASDLYVTWTDFNDLGANCGGPGNAETDIKETTSSDGGSSWSSPVIAAFACGSAFVQGSQVAVDPSGNVFVAYERVASDFYTREIDITESTNGGASFGPSVTVSAVEAVGDGDLMYGLQGFIRDFEFPSLGIGKPGAPNAGELFLMWNDGNRRVADQWQELMQDFYGLGDGKYGASNAMFTSSTDQGATWSTPVRVNTVFKALTDHFQPTINADPSGTVEACWYDRNVFHSNYDIKRECATSTDSGGTWGKPWKVALVGPSVVNQDVLIAPDYMGDYDGLATDYTRANDGFLGGFVQTLTGSQRVVATR